MNKLIPFAGSEEAKSEPRPALVLNLFRQGLDTYDIARRLGIPEAQASWMLHLARNAERALMSLPL